MTFTLKFLGIFKVRFRLRAARLRKEEISKIEKKTLKINVFFQLLNFTDSRDVKAILALYLDFTGTRRYTVIQK